MKAKDLREKSSEELKNLESELKEKLFNLNFQKALGQLQNPMKVKETKRDIARIKTILKERGEENE